MFRSFCTIRGYACGSQLSSTSLRRGGEELADSLGGQFLSAMDVEETRHVAAKRTRPYVRTTAEVRARVAELPDRDASVFFGCGTEKKNTEPSFVDFFGLHASFCTASITS